jgi:hypothetical protein
MITPVRTRKICNGTGNCTLVQEAARRRAVGLRWEPTPQRLPRPWVRTREHGARNHVHRREPLYIRPALLREPDRYPMLPQLDEYTLRRGLGGARYSFDLARMRFGRARLGTGRQQVRSRPASGLSQLQKALGQQNYRASPRR